MTQKNVKVVSSKSSKKNVIPASVKVEAKPKKVEKVTKERPEAHYLDLQRFLSICDGFTAKAKAAAKKAGLKATVQDHRDDPKSDEWRLYIGSTRVAVAYRKYEREAGSVFGLKKRLCFNPKHYGTINFEKMRKTGAVGYDPTTLKADVFLKELFGTEEAVTLLEKTKGKKEKAA